jgi:hypothetical protein
MIFLFTTNFKEVECFVRGGWKICPGLIKMSFLVHACNPSYWGGRDQEDPDLRAAWGKKLVRLLASQGPEFKPQNCQKKKKSLLYS